MEDVMRWQHQWFVGVALGVVAVSGAVVWSQEGRPAPGSVAVSGGARTGRGRARRPAVRRQDGQDADQSDRADPGRPDRRRRSVSADPAGARVIDLSSGDGAARHDRRARPRRPEPAERVGGTPHDDHGSRAPQRDLDAGFTTVVDMDSRGGFGTVELRNAINSGLVRVRGCRWPVSRSIRGAARRTRTPCRGFFSGFTEARTSRAVARARRGARAEAARHRLGQDLHDAGFRRRRVERVPARRIAGAIPSLTLEEVEAIVDEAHRMGLKVACHTYGGEGMRTCVQAGVDPPDAHARALQGRRDVEDGASRRSCRSMMTIDDLAGLEAEDKRLSGGKARGSAWASRRSGSCWRPACRFRSAAARCPAGIRTANRPTSFPIS